MAITTKVTLKKKISTLINTLKVKEIPASASTLTCQQLNDGLTQVQRDLIQRATVLRTGQTTSYALEDDGDLEKGRQSAFATLNCNNEFGNTNRLTDTKGAQNYDGAGGDLTEYVIDHFTRLAWYRLLQPAKVWASAMADARGFSTHFTNWRIPNTNEMFSIADQELLRVLNYAPFNLGGGAAAAQQLWLSSTPKNSTTQARIFFINHTATQVIGRQGESTKSSGSFQFLLCRDHY